MSTWDHSHIRFPRHITPCGGSSTVRLRFLKTVFPLVRTLGTSGCSNGHLKGRSGALRCGLKIRSPPFLPDDTPQYLSTFSRQSKLRSCVVSQGESIIFIFEVQIVFALKQAEIGRAVAEVCHKLGISAATSTTGRIQQHRHGGAEEAAPVGLQGDFPIKSALPGALTATAFQPFVVLLYSCPC